LNWGYRVSYPYQPYQPPAPPPSPPPPPRRRVARGVGIGVAVVAVVGLGVGRGLTQPHDIPVARSPATTTATAPTTVSLTTTVLGTDNHAQLTLPDGWQKVGSLANVDGAVLQYGHLKQASFAVVVPAGKRAATDLATFEDHVTAHLTSQILGVSIEPSRQVQVAGQQAVRFAATGTVENESFFYLCTLVSTPSGYYEVLGWTLGERRVANEPVLEAVESSFRLV
jgi:hypothetical protein